MIEVGHTIVLPRFGNLDPKDVDQKGPGDLVTVADHEAEDAISQALLRLTPGALVVGEEGAFANPRLLADLAAAELAWVIDPIDGTRNFVKQSPDFAIIVAEVRAGTTVAGWIYLPAYETMYVGELGGGVTVDGTRIEPRTQTRDLLRGAAYVRVEPCELDLRRGWGSCGIDYPKLLTGEADFLAYRQGLPWDHLAGTLMVTELGGRAATWAGQEYGTGHMDAPISVIPAADWDRVRTNLRPVPPRSPSRPRPDHR